MSTGPSSLSELSSRPVGWAVSPWQARGRVRRSMPRRALFGAYDCAALARIVLPQLRYWL